MTKQVISSLPDDEVVSIDAGRSALKIITEATKDQIRIPSVHGIVSKEFLNNAILTKKELIVSVDGIKNHDPNQIWIIGRAAIDRLKSDQLIEVNETKEFLKNATIYMLGSLTETSPDGGNINLVTQLTDSDMKKYGKAIKTVIDGKKIVTRYDSKGNEDFTTEYNITTDVYLQGLCAYFDMLFDKSGKVNEDLLRESVLVVDVGHQTTDIVLVKGLSVAAVGSYPVGSGSIFYSISDSLRKEGLTLAAKDIEWRFIEGRTEVKSMTESFDIAELMEEQAKKTAQKLINYTVQEFAGETIDKVILTGGSSKLFYTPFKEKWKFCLQPDNPQFGNCSGALKYKLYGERLK